MKIARGNFPQNFYSFDVIGEEENPLELAIRSTEAEIATFGWNKPARLLVVWHRPEENKVLPNKAASQTLVTSEVLMFKEFYENPLNGLRIWVNHFFAKPESALWHLGTLVDRDFYGWQLFTEAWTEDTEPRDIRLGFLATRDGRLVELRRTRGEEGELDAINVREIAEAPEGDTLPFWLMFLTAITHDSLTGEGLRAG